MSEAERQRRLERFARDLREDDDECDFHEMMNRLYEGVE